MKTAYTNIFISKRNNVRDIARALSEDARKASEVSARHACPLANAAERKHEVSRQAEIVIIDYDRHRKTRPQPQGTGKVQARGCGGRVPHFAGEGAEENRPE